MRVLHKVYTRSSTPRCAARSARSAIGLIPDRRSASSSSRSSAASSCPSSRRATSGSARRCRCPSRSSSRRSTSARMRRILRGCPDDKPCDANRTHPEVDDRRLAARPPRRRHRRRAASTTSSSSRRSSRSTSGRAASPRRSSPTSCRSELAGGVPRRRLQLLAVHLRQRRGGAVAASRARTRSRCRPRPRAPTRRTPTTIVDVMAHVPGVEGPRHLPVARAAEREDRPRPRARARATASTPATSTAVIQAAVGGQAVTQVYEGEKHFDLTVRWLEPYRKLARGHPRDHRARRPTAAQSRSGSSRRSRSRTGRRSSTARTAAATRP